MLDFSKLQMEEVGPEEDLLEPAPFEEGQREEEAQYASAGLSGLQISSLDLLNFRNYERFRLDDLGPLTIFVGQNAVGKTSAIEAIQMLTALKSFRTSQYSQMVRWGAPGAQADLLLRGNGRLLDVHLGIQDGKRSYMLNGKPRRIQDLKGLLPAVSFSPDDLNLAKGSNSVRRNALDNLGSQLSKNFFAVKNDYAKLIRQKNCALKEEAPDSYIDSLDEVLVRVGAQLMVHRLVIVEKLRPHFQRFYDEITAGAEVLDMMYVPSWEDLDIDKIVAMGEDPYSYALSGDSFSKENARVLLAEHLANVRETERARGKSILGPQSDQLLFVLNGRNALHYSSQGQQRSIVLAFKLAEAAVIQESLDQKPVLLLDDVMSELDEARRAYFMQFISNDIQTFITTTNLDYFSESVRQSARLVHLS